MDVAALAKAQAFKRVAMGTGRILAPGIVGRVWSASEARDERAKVLARALGVRDLAAIVSAGPALPLSKRVSGGLLAAGSAAVAAAYAARLPRA